MKPLAIDLVKDAQKKYEDYKVRNMEFQIGKSFFIKVSPRKVS